MAKIPSIALIPSGYKATKIYSVLPTDGNGDFTFDRGTSTDQTRVNKDGLIENVDQDVPRLDYLDGGCPSLLLEPSSTNLITYSEDFSNAAWGKTNSPTISYNVGLSPDGTVSTTTIEDTTGGSYKRVSFVTTSVSNATYTASIFVKKETSETNYGGLTIDFTGGTRNVFYVVFDAVNGIGIDSVVSTNAVDNIKVVDFSDTFWRLEVTITDTGTNTSVDFEYFATLSDNLNGTITPAIGSVREIWGAQLEQLSYATSYIPTSGSTEIRAAETCNGAGTTAEINSQEGVLFVEMRALADDLTFRNISLGQSASSNNRVQLFYLSNSNEIWCNYRVGGSTLFSIEGGVIDITDYSKAAFKYKSGEFEFYINGLKVGVNTNTTLISSNTLDTLAFNQGGGGSPFYGRVKKLSVYDSALNDSQLEALTGFGSFAEMKSYLSYS